MPLFLKESVEDSPATTNDGRAKRWVVVRPPGAQTGLLLAQADGERQEKAAPAAFHITIFRLCIARIRIDAQGAQSVQGSCNF